MTANRAIGSDLFHVSPMALPKYLTNPRHCFFIMIPGPLMDTEI